MFFYIATLIVIYYLNDNFLYQISELSYCSQQFILIIYLFMLFDKFFIIYNSKKKQFLILHQYFSILIYINTPLPSV